MKSLFDQKTYQEAIERLHKLTPASKAKWGKMNVAQMLAHCKAAFNVPLSERKLPRAFIGRLLGWAIKTKLYNDSPWKQSLPTSPAFIVKDERDFNEEKQALISLIDKFYRLGPSGISKYPHPFFGKFTEEQWGMSMYKHLDHHLRQFAV